MTMTEMGEDQPREADPTTDYEVAESQWDEQWPGTGEDAQPQQIDNLDEVTGFPDAVGTPDVIETVRDAEPYMAPVDPPVLPGGAEAIHTGVGFGTSTEEEMGRGGPYVNDADLEEEATLLLRQDSLTSHYDLVAEANDGVITIRGLVSDLDDAEHALAIIGEMQGIDDVVDEMTIDPDLAR
jgi:hypothetical protein